MIKKTGRNIKDELVDKRHEDRRQLLNGNMRSHGKLWGMDCFSWFNPDLDALKSAIQHFHLPVIWVSTTSLINELLIHDNAWMKNLEVICTIDDNLDQLNMDKLQNGTTIMVNSMLVEALKIIQQINHSNRILLISSDRNECFKDQLVVDQFITAAKAL